MNVSLSISNLTPFQDFSLVVYKHDEIPFSCALLIVNVNMEYKVSLSL